MRLNRLGLSPKARFVAWTFLGVGMAVAVASPLKAGSQEPSGRKTTEPPTAGSGKLGQDLFLAIDHRDLPAVQALIKRGADPNSRNGLDFTPLYIAAASHQNDVVQALIKAGAKADATSPYGTPLTFACMTANVDAEKLLLSLGANPGIVRTDGLTPLMISSYNGVPPMVGDLLAKKVDVNAQNEGGSTALILAARGGHDDVGRMLLAAGATVDTADNEGQTALMAAALNGHDGFVQLLLGKGANANAKDSKGRTALMLAASYGDHPKVIQALLKGGADPKVVDASGRGAAAIAASRGYGQCLTLLGGRGSTPRAAIRNPRQAVTVSLKILQSSMRDFSKMASCLSCHQDGLGRIATGTAKQFGFGLDRDVVQTQEGRINGALNALKPLHEGALKSPEVMKQIPLIEINEVSDFDGWLLSGMAANKEAPTAATAAMALVLARQQSPAGFWSFSVPRVPMQSSFFTFTALSIRSLSVYGPKSHSKEIAGQIHRAKAWLLSAKTQNSEDRASKLLGLKWAGATASETKKAMAAVLADQRPDGGWSQLPGMPSDAYAAGQALYALRVGGGLPASSAAYRRGVQYLLRTQDDDGTWFVNKRAIPANNYFDAGFPHGESQYASFNATCWATLALLETLGKKG